MNRVKSGLLIVLYFLMAGLNEVVFSQVVSGSVLKWMMNSSDPDYELAFISGFINPGDYEEVSVVMNNKSSEQIYFEVTIFVIDYCGETKKYTIKRTVPPNTIIGNRPAYDGFGFATACKEIKKYEGVGRSRIKALEYKVDKIIKGKNNGTSGGNSGSGNSGSGNNSGENGHGSGTPSGNSNGTNNSATCLRQDISIANGPSMNCIQLRWFTQSSIQINDQSNEINTKNNRLSTEFVLHYRKLTDISWKTTNISGYQMGYNVKMLDPCTKYEVRLQRNCGNGNYSDFSNTITFTTTCPMPATVKAERITNTSAYINSFYAPGVNVCSINLRNIVLQIEYVSIGNNWQSVYSNLGTGGSVLNNLQPNTSYRVRVRYDFGSGIFSKYTNEIVFKTD